MKFNFTRITLIFSVLAFLFSAIPAVVLIGMQIGLTKIGIECSKAWIIIWILSGLLAIFQPVIFYRHLKSITLAKIESLKSQYIVFNLLELIFIQASLIPLFTTSQTLCYVSDGQNGIELIFTSWLSLPVLIILSFIFSETIKSNRF